MQLIAAAEGERRGLYGGAVGYLGYDGNLDTAITIRSAVLKRRPGPRPHGRRDRRRVGARDGVRGDGAQGGGAPAGDRAREAVGDAGERPADARRRREPAAPAGGSRDDPGHRQLRQFTFNLVQALQAAGRGRAGRPQRRDRSGRASRRWPTTPPRTCGASSSRPAPATRTTPACRSTPIEVAARAPDPAARGVPRDAVDGRGVRRRRSCARRRSSTARRPRSTHDGAGLLRGCRRRSWPPATTRCAWTRRPCRRSCGSPR